MFDVQRTSAAAYVLTVDGDTFRYSEANAACLALTRLSSSFHAGLTPHDCFPDAVAERILERYRSCRDRRESISYVSEAQLPTGKRNWRTTLFPIVDDGGRVTSIVGICADAEEGVAESSILALNEKLEQAMGAIDGGFWVYEIATRVFETSLPLAELLAGPGHAPLNLAEYASHVHAGDLGMNGVMNPREDRSLVDYRIITWDGRTRWMRSRRRTIRDEAGNALRVVGLVNDITKQKTALLALESEASTDSLTGLKNRRAFDRIAAQALRDSRGSDAGIGLLLIDLDGFKPINDMHGHRAGDAILRKVARRLARLVRKSDTLARIGGDEFAILIGKASKRGRETLDQRIERAFEKPFSFEGLSIHVGISIGAGFSGPATTSLDALFEQADRNLYATKKSRRTLTA